MSDALACAHVRPEDETNANHVTRPRRVLAIDVGERRVGVAVADVAGGLATPLTTILRRSHAEDVARFAQIAREQQVDTLLAGLPLNDDGSMGPQARQAARYARRLASALGLPLVLWDERHTTAEAERRLREAGRRRGTAPQLDAVAAAIILQDYLDAEGWRSSPA